MQTTTLRTIDQPAAHGRRVRILEKWSGSPFDPSVSRPELLHEIFEAQADTWPWQTAVECGDARLSYGELDARANRLAHHLRRLGIRRGICAAVLLERSMEVYVAVLAVLKAGAAYVPLDPDLPEERIRYILADSGARAVVTTSALARKCGARTNLVCIDRRCNEIAGCPASRLSRAETGTTPRDLCYVIYTSGSTGLPKGVAVEHRSVCNFVRAERQVFPAEPFDRVYQGLSLAFDAAVEEMWLAFSAGATLVVGTREVVRALPDLARFLTDARVTVVSTVPTLWAMLEDDVPTLRMLVLGGEPCPKGLVRRWWAPGRRIINTYGPTEATVTTTWSDLDPDGPVTIGRPLSNYRVYVLDDERRLVPPGEPGELYVGGVGLARGYAGRPDLTRQSFVPNPFDSDGTAPRIYKTGDRVQWTKDGELLFLGRLDTHTKLRGFRVELAEIESVLLQCPDVQATAVAVHERAEGLAQLIAYVVPRENALLDLDRLWTTLRAWLPPYMVPAILEPREALPMLPSGKLDRAALGRHARVGAPRREAGCARKMRVLSTITDLATIRRILTSSALRERDHVKAGIDPIIKVTKKMELR